MEPISTYQAYLMKGTGSEGSLIWAKLIDIKDFPDLQGDPNMITTTTLSDAEETQIAGIKKSEGKAFTSNYKMTDYDTIKALEGTQVNVALWFGGTMEGVPDGHNGKFEGKGSPSIKITGKGVDDVVEMVTTFAMSKGFVKKA